MTASYSTSHERFDPDSARDGQPGTVQLLVADEGNRTAIQAMLSDHFEVNAGQSIRDADLYLIEDRLFSEYRDELRERVEEARPAFCPVVLIRRETTRLAHWWTDDPDREGPVLVDDVVDAPIDPTLLIQRLHSLVVRQQQSQELLSHVSTLAEREQDLRRFERGIEATGNGIVLTDTTGTIEYVNPAFEEITGYTGTDVIGHTPRILQPEGAAAAFDDQFWRTITDRTEWEGEVVVERKEGTRCVADTTVTTILDDGGELEGFVIVLRDVTERIQREQELQNREQELDLLRQILTRYLRHNLRNDLNVIHGYARLLEDAEISTAQHAQWATGIVETTERLVEKSDTARRFSTLLERDTELLPRDLSKIVTDATHSVREQYPDVEIELDVPDACEIRTRDGILTAIEELIENAAQHSDPDSPRVQVRVQEIDGARLVVEDNGPGIPAVEIAALERGGETPISHSQGVGLWLSQWVIEGVDGQLSFETADPGTRITVEFPPPDRVGTEGIDVPTLKEREQRLQTVINRMTDAIVEIDSDWEITFLDDQAEAILGVDADASLGRSLWDVFSDARGTRFEDVYRDAMESRSSRRIEEYYGGIDGWLEVYVYPEFDGGLSFYFRDVTDRNVRKRELQRARSRMELALEVTDATVWEWDFQTNSVTTHPEVHVGFESKIRTIEDFYEGIHPDDRKRVRETLQTAVETNTPYHVDYRLWDGETVRWMEDYGEVQQTQTGTPTRIIGVAREITERKEREQTLRERVKELTAVHNATRVFETTNAPIERVLSEFVEVIPQSFQQPAVTEVRLTWDDLEVSTANFEPRERMLSARANLSDGAEFRLDVVSLVDRPTEDGELFLPEEREVLDTLTTLANGYVERRRHLTELEQTEELLTNAERLGDVGAWEVDLETGEVSWTEGAKRIYGVSDEFDPTLEELLEFAHSGDRKTLVQTVETCIETGEQFDLELQIQTAAGDDRWIHIEGEPAENEDGRQTLRGYVQDVTERKERARRYEAIFNQTYQFTGLLEPDGTLVEANDTALEFGGLAREEVLGTKVWNTHWFTISPETRRQTKADVKRAAQGEFVRRELEIRGADGTLVIDFSIRPVVDRDGNVALLIPEGREITDRKERERELQETNAVLSTLFEMLPVGILVEDASRNVLAINESLFDLFEHPGAPEDVLGADGEQFVEELSELFAAPDEFVGRITDVIAKREPVDDEEIVLRDGRTFARSYRPIELPHGGGHLWIYR